MLKYDYHIHSSFSGDSNENLEKIIEKALSLELREIAITDHLDYDYPEKDMNFLLDPNDYTTKLQSLKDKYKDKINIKVGIELGLQPHLKEKIFNLNKNFNFDFIIGSSHSTERKEFCRGKYFENKTPDEAHHKYFEEVLECIKTFDEFSIYGHLDFIMRYGGKEFRNMNYSLHNNLIDEILKTLIHLGKGIEINSSGFRYGLNQSNPHINIIKRYKKFGGEIITVGSDAHSAKDICKDFDKVYEILKDSGFKYISTFTNKMVEFVKV